MHESLILLLKNAQKEGVEMTENRREIARRVWNTFEDDYDAEFMQWNESFEDVFCSIESDRELVSMCEEIFCISLSAKELNRTLTFGQIILRIDSEISGKIRVRESNCHSQAIFYICRNILIQKPKFCRANIILDTHLTWDFITKNLSKEVYQATNITINGIVPTQSSLFWNISWGILSFYCLFMLVPLVGWGLALFVCIVAGGCVHGLADCYQKILWKWQTVSLREVISYVATEMNKNDARLMRPM
jgi:hypothetical protein